MTSLLSHAIRAGAGAALATVVARRLLDDRPPGGPSRWARWNHRGDEVSLLEGPALVSGLVVGAGLTGGGALGAAAGAVGVAAGALGVVDDLAEARGPVAAKGLRGHLGALSAGTLTTGGLKLLGIGASSLVAAAVLTPRAGAAGSARARHVIDVVSSAALIASSANLVNLFDLRPGRALKAAAIGAGVVALGVGAAQANDPARGRAAAGLLGATVGSAVASAPRDLAGKDMLGDGGANALGAVLGAAAVIGAPRGVRLALLTATTALTLASERVSFSAVIDRIPVLSRLDAAGRRPAAGASGT